MPLTSQVRLNDILQEFDAQSKLAPSGAVSLTLTSGGAPWTPGAKVEFIAAGSVALVFHMRSATLSEPTVNAEYEVIVYKGLAGAEVEIARIDFVRTNVQNRSSFVTFSSEQVPAGTRISCAIQDSVGGSSLNVKLGYHTHP